MLTEWRHFGGETNFIDFSANLLVALFFACHGKNGNDGQVIALPVAKFRVVDGIDYGSPRPETCIVRPAKTPLSAPRTLTQNSVFLHVPGGLIPKEACLVIDVPSELKVPCLAYLKKNFGIDVYTIYNDLFGYLSNEEDLIKVEQLYHEGLALAMAGKLEDAIERFDKAIQMDPMQAEIHYNRGQVHYRLEEFEKAKGDYDSAIALDPQNATYHFSNGVVNFELGDFGNAQHELNDAIEFESRNAEFHFSRGLVNMQLGNIYDAIADYDLAIGINPQVASYYFNRGVAKDLIGDSEGAMNDFAQARNLG